jgi:hypothetical protein
LSIRTQSAGVQLRREVSAHNDLRIDGDAAAEGAVGRFNIIVRDMQEVCGREVDVSLRSGGTDRVKRNASIAKQPGDTQPTDLNTLVNIPNETLVDAMDINNAGQILARGFNGYYIFTPIPEPAMLGATAITSILLRRRAR